MKGKASINEETQLRLYHALGSREQQNTSLICCQSRASLQPITPQISSRVIPQPSMRIFQEEEASWEGSQIMRSGPILITTGHYKWVIQQVSTVQQREQRRNIRNQQNAKDGSHLLKNIKIEQRLTWRGDQGEIQWSPSFSIPGMETHKICWNIKSDTPFCSNQGVMNPKHFWQVQMATPPHHPFIHPILAAQPSPFLHSPR